MGDFEEGRKLGLWGDDGIPYDIKNQLEDDEYNEDDNDPFNHFTNDFLDENKEYSKEQFPGMRDSGSVKNTLYYTIAEYENKDYRLEAIAKRIYQTVGSHFILYDYKGSIQSNNQLAIRTIRALYDDNITVGGDILNTSDSLLNIEPLEQKYDSESVNESFLNIQTDGPSLWSMQLFPKDFDLNLEKEFLTNNSIIGMVGAEEESLSINYFKKMRLNDVVLIRKEKTPVAIIRITGEMKKAENNTVSPAHLNKFRYIREIEVIELAKNDMTAFPYDRLVISHIKDKNSDAYKYIINWYERTSNSKQNPIIIPDIIKFENANPSFGVHSVANVLSSIITDIPDKSGMMVGIFGKWGRGKTYLVNKIWDRIKEDNDKYYLVNYSAWKYQDTKESWAYLYENLINQYLENSKTYWKLGWLVKPIIKTCKLIKLNINKNGFIPLIIFVLLNMFYVYLSFLGGNSKLINLAISSLGVLFLIKVALFYIKHKNEAVGIINKYTKLRTYSNCLGLQAEIEKEIEILLKTWVNKDGKVILFVDDIDRCDTSKIISIIDGLRIILDNPEIHKRLVILTAIDEEILERSFEQKYKDLLHRFNNNLNKDEMDNSRNTLFKEYLEKIFIIGIKLNHLDKNEAREYLTKLIPLRTMNNTIKSVTKDNINRTNPISESTSEKLKGHDNTLNRPIDTTLAIESVNYEGDDPSIRQHNLSPSEESALIKSIDQIKDPTPRKIKIFYYKYLILKKMYHSRLKEKNLIDKWEKNHDEKTIIDVLIHISNEGSLVNYEPQNINEDILNELKYSANMLSVL
ncbi:MAG: hypothetical protein ACI88H_000776 [Cocleimonas sp.]|jgi:hypothetical protein